jgi:hypothetical protein
MSAGKSLSIAGGIIVLLATFLLCWITIDLGGTLYYASGIGTFKRVMEMYAQANFYATQLSLPVWSIYLIASILIWFLFSGVSILFGAGSRVASILGSLMPILVAIGIFMYTMGIIPQDWIVYFFTETDPFVTDLLPLRVMAPGAIGLGTYFLIVGGILGFIGGLLPRPEYYY